MYRLLFISIFLGAINLSHASIDSLRYSNAYEKLEFSICLSELELEVKCSSFSNVKSYQKLLDSIKKNSIHSIKDTIFWKYGGSIGFEQILVKMVKKGKVNFYYSNDKLNNNKVKNRTEFIKCCRSQKDLNNNKLTTRRKRFACSKAMIFRYDGIIVGTLTIVHYNRIINCI